MLNVEEVGIMVNGLLCTSWINLLIILRQSIDDVSVGKKEAKNGKQIVDSDHKNHCRIHINSSKCNYSSAALVNRSPFPQLKP